MEPQDSNPELRFPYVGNLSPEEAQKSLMGKEGWVSPQELVEAEEDYWANMDSPQVIADAPTAESLERAAEMWATWTKDKQREMYLADQIKDKLQRNAKKPRGWGERKTKYFVDFLVSEMFANPSRYTLSSMQDEAVEVLHFLSEKEQDCLCHLLLAGEKRKAVNAIVEFLKRYGG